MMEPIDLARQLFPINRSLTGEGVRKSLNLINQILVEMKIKSYKCGQKCYDWVIPPEWNIREGWIKRKTGETVVDVKNNNLHVMGYSIAVDKRIKREELIDHIFSIPDMPNAIPYMTSYYKRKWAFCMAENQKNELQDEEYDVLIDSTLNERGVLNYGEMVIKGKSKKEVLLSTYICHPSMANNEVSGPVVTTYIAKWLKEKKERKYTYRILFIPETMGSIAYISKNLQRLKKNVIAGFVLTCIGDERNYSYLPSKNGNTIADKAAKISLENIDKNYKEYTWNDRGSDERQYCSQGVDLPICSIMRTKYGEYPEYHTSLDDFSVVTNKGLLGGIKAVQDAIDVIETNYKPKCNIICEPQLEKRNLYPRLTLADKDGYKKLQDMLNIISYCDGEKDIFEIANLCGLSYNDAYTIIKKLSENDVVSPG